MKFWSRVAAMLPIVLNDQGIVDNLTENNKTTVWVSRRIGEDQLYVQCTPGIGLPTSLVVKYSKNMNPTLLLDDSVKNRYKSEMILLASISHDNIINVLDVIERDEAIMHHGCNKPIVHHNINSHNILLDQNFKAVIASFGAAQMNMARLGQPLVIMNLPLGNFGYAAPEYGMVTDQVMEKVDIYSFGVVLLELVTGRVANGGGADGHLAIWAQKNFNGLMANNLKKFKTEVDKGIPDQGRYIKEMAIMFRLGMDCTVRDPQERPSMVKVLERLRHGRSPFRGLLTCYLPS